jgi:hypothetical protein
METKICEVCEKPSNSDQTEWDCVCDCHRPLKRKEKVNAR